MTVFKDVRTLVKDAITAAVAFLKGETPDRPRHLQQRQDRCSRQASLRLSRSTKTMSRLP